MLGALLLASTHAATIELETHGGDAWAFELPVSGRISSGTCTSVSLESSRAAVTAAVFDDRFAARALLNTGDNLVRAVCIDRSGKRTESSSQSWRVALPDIPKARVRVRIEERSIRLDAGASEQAPATAAPVVRFQWRARANNPEALRSMANEPLGEAFIAQGEELRLATPTRDGEYYVHLRVEDALGRSDESATVFRVANGAARLVDLESEHPRWFDNAVLYGAAPYQFEPQSFIGIKNRLDDIAALGATAVWLSPVTAAAEDDFGYAVLDQFSIRADFGAEAGLRALIEHAHSLGLRVLVDFVPNHFSQSHSYYKDAEQHGSRSPYYDWFDRDAGGTVTQYFDWAHLKNLNFDDPEVRNYITAAATQFIRDYDVDGFRIDASWAVAQRAPEYWPRLRAELKRIDPDIVLIAEASAREPYHVSHGFDAAYDWTASLGQWAWHDAFTTEGEIDLAQLRVALTNDGKGYPPDSLILRFINNNDTGERFVSRFGPDIAAVAATLLFTLPGIPLIYNGDEMGAQFLPYDEGPPIQWRSTALTDHYRRLASLRHEIRALQTRDFKLVDIHIPQHVLAFVRPGTNATEDLLVLLNFSTRDQTVKPVGAPAREIFARFRKSRDLLSGEFPDKPFRVPAHSSLILQQIR